MFHDRIRTLFCGFPVRSHLTICFFALLAQTGVGQFALWRFL